MSTGRKCDGYGPKNAAMTLDASKAISTRILSQTVAIRTLADEAERRSFHFFYTRSAPQLSGSFGSNFWNRLVLQASQSDAGIRHALVALGSTYEQFENCAKMDKRADHNATDFALQQYNLAIKEFVSPNVARSGPLRADVYLISCIIFICIEILRGHMVSAVMLVKNGIALLHQLDEKPRSSASPSFEFGTSCVPMSTLEAMFVSLETQVIALIGHAQWEEFTPRRKITGLDFPVPELFLTLEEARDCLEHYRLKYEYEKGEIKKEFKDSLNLHRYDALNASYSDLFPRWESAFKSLLESRGTTFTRNERRGVAMLQIQKLTLLTYVRGPNPGINDQMLWDDYCSVFEQIVNLSAAAMDTPLAQDEPPEPALFPSFSLERAILVPLFDVACKCRHPIIRRQAIWLLRATKRHEGFLNGVLSAQLTSQVVAIEEEGLVNVRSCSDVPASARISDVAPLFDPSGKLVQICYRRPESPLGKSNEFVVEPFIWK